MDEKPLHKITVKELCAVADVNRSTFYAHYEDIYCMVQDIEKGIIEGMPLLLFPMIEKQCEILGYAEYINKNYKAIDLLVKNGLFTQAAIDHFVDYYIDQKLPRQNSFEDNTGRT